MASRIDAALFDLGGVFTESPFAIAERVAAELGAEPARLLELVFGPYHEDTDHPWHRLERGEMSFLEARDQIVALGVPEGLDTDPMRVLALISAGGTTRDPVVATVKLVRSHGCRTALVTNNAREFRDAWRALLPFDDLFDVIVDSSEIGVRKPDPEIFRLTLERLGVTAERSAFLDDHPGNVRAAERLGMHGILVGIDPTEALARLTDLLND